MLKLLWCVMCVFVCVHERMRAGVCEWIPASGYKPPPSVLEEERFKVQVKVKGVDDSIFTSTTIKKENRSS